MLCPVSRLSTAAARTGRGGGANLAGPTEALCGARYSSIRASLCAHQQLRAHTFVPCRSQRRQRHIWAYQPGPSSSKPSCAVSSPQSGQKRRNRSGGSRKRISLRPAWSDTDDQFPNAENLRFQRLRLHPSTAARPLRSRKLRTVKGKTERAIIVSSCKNTHVRASNVPAGSVVAARRRVCSVARDRATAPAIGTSQPKSGWMSPSLLGPYAGSAALCRGWFFSGRAASFIACRRS
jgi:hypothetical protein